MNSILRVYISEHWPERPAARWVLLDPVGRLLQQGESDALHWPPADSCEAVLAGQQTSCLRASLPSRVAKRNLAQVINGAIEDRLLEDLDRVHVTVLARQPEAADVLVVARARLRNILAQFSALNRPLAAAYSELQCLPGQPGTNRLASGPQAWLVTREGGLPYVVDRDGVANGESGLMGFPPGAEVQVFHAPDERPTLDAWQGLLPDSRINLAGEYRWHDVAPGAVDLLHGEFASRHKRNDVWRAIKPAAWVAGAAIGLYGVMIVVQVAVLLMGASASERRKLELFQAAFPSVPVMAPLAQARRQLDALRASYGQPRSDDALAMLAAMAEVLGARAQGAIEEVSFAEHRLTVHLSAGTAHQLSLLSSGLADRGYKLTPSTSASGRTSVVIEVEKSK